MKAPALLLALLCLSACAPEQRVVSVRGILHNVPGAQSQLKPAPQKPSPAARAGRATLLGGEDGQPAADATPLELEQDDGSVILVSHSPRHVIRHLGRALIAQDLETFYDQLLADRTKTEYVRRGLDPHDAAQFLLDQRKKVLELLQRVPMGELSPGAFMRSAGAGVYRLSLSAPPAGARFTTIDFVWERGVCKLVVIR